MHSATPSTAKAATWMAGWLTLMLIITVAGREATRDVAVFQLMAMRSVIGLLLLWPNSERARLLAQAAQPKFA